MSAINPLTISPPESHYLKDEEMSNIRVMGAVIFSEVGLVAEEKELSLRQTVKTL
jgi:hypothetical protein